MSDLTSIEGVVSLMSSSKNESEWNANCDKIKEENGGEYPDFMYYEIIIKGVLNDTRNKNKW